MARQVQAVLAQADLFISAKLQGPEDARRFFRLADAVKEHFANDAGHIGGANQLAAEIAGAQPVISFGAIPGQGGFLRSGNLKT